MKNQKIILLAKSRAVLISLGFLTVNQQIVRADQRLPYAPKNQLEIPHQGDTHAHSGRSADSASKYLAAASVAFAKQNFERARPYFDKAFLAAADLSSVDQKKFLTQVSEVINQTSDRQDFDTYKYFALNRLRLLKSKAVGTPTERYNEVQTIAFSCSENHRYKEALALLQESLADLQASAPQSDSVGWCLYTLARISEDSGDLPAACHYYERQIAFTKSLEEKVNYHRALESYLTFLITHKLNSEIKPTARAFLDEIVRTGNKDRVPLQMIARGVANCDTELSDKFYRLAFEQEKLETQSAMNISYGNTICEWASLLHQAAQTNRAIAVLQEGMSFCRTSRWPDALDRNMKQMSELLQQLLAETNRGAEATQARNTFINEMRAFRDKNEVENQTRIENQINSATVEPLIKIRALMEKADRAFIAQNCQEAIDAIQQAVSVYEINSKNSNSEQMYDSLFNITRRFQKCGRQSDAKALLMRIVKARMVSGFRDPLEKTMWRSNCGGTTWAFDELVGPFYSSPDQTDKEMLKLANESGNINNEIFVIDYMASRSRGEAKIELLKELEALRSEKTDKGPLLFTMLRTADDLAYLKKWDEAMKKCREALLVSQTSKFVSPAFNLSNSFYNIGRGFVAAGQLASGAELHLIAYKLSLENDSDATIELNLRYLSDLIKAYVDKVDISAAAKLYNELVRSTSTKLGPDNTFTRMWLIKMSTFYLRNGDVIKGKQAYSTLAVSLFRPGLSVSKVNEENLVEYAKVLTKAGCSKEAARINAKLTELESQHCGAHSK